MTTSLKATRFRRNWRMHMMTSKRSRELTRFTTPRKCLHRDWYLCRRQQDSFGIFLLGVQHMLLFWEHFTTVPCLKVCLCWFSSNIPNTKERAYTNDCFVFGCVCYTSWGSEERWTTSDDRESLQQPGHCWVAARCCETCSPELCRPPDASGLRLHDARITAGNFLFLWWCNCQGMMLIIFTRNPHREQHI